MTEQVILPVPETVVYLFKTHVNKIEEKFEPLFNRATGKMEAGASLGWFVHFNGSTESINFGDDRPEFEVGDAVEIRIRKAK